MFIPLYIQCVYTPLFNPNRVIGTVYNTDDKMNKKTKLSREYILNVVLSLGVVVLAYFTFKFTNAPIENLFLPIIFLLTLIYLELPKQNNK